MLSSIDMDSAITWDDTKNGFRTTFELLIVSIELFLMLCLAYRVYFKDLL